MGHGILEAGSHSLHRQNLPVYSFLFFRLKHVSKLRSIQWQVFLIPDPLVTQFPSFQQSFILTYYFYFQVYFIQIQITLGIFLSFFSDFKMTSILTYTFKNLPSSTWALRFCKFNLFFLFQHQIWNYKHLTQTPIILRFVNTVFCLPALRPLSCSSQLRAAPGIVICK